MLLPFDTAPDLPKCHDMILLRHAFRQEGRTALRHFYGSPMLLSRVVLWPQAFLLKRAGLLGLLLLFCILSSC